MDKVIITPKLLNGELTVPPSKSMAHRLLICSALCKGTSLVRNLSYSDDIKATIDALRSLGARITLDGNDATVTGITSVPENAHIDCGESGSTLRFLIPVVSALGVNGVFNGRGRLPKRPITPFVNELSVKGVTFDYKGTMPFSAKGQLVGGKFVLYGNVSSQFITGLMFALPLLDSNSEIVLLTPLESKSYVNLTINALSQFGIKIDETEFGWSVKGGQTYKQCDVTVEGDYSQAAFFYVANALGSNIEIKGLCENSCQGDKFIVDIIDIIRYNKSQLKAFDIDGSDIPDIVPILAVLACFCEGTSVIGNVSRLRIKECDRLEAIMTCLDTLGANVRINDECLIIGGGMKSFKGGKVKSYNDHRIAMCMAICATRCTSPLEIVGASSVSKSYPDFFETYKKLGGIVNGIFME